MLLQPLNSTNPWYLAISGIQIWCEDDKTFDGNGLNAWGNEAVGSAETVTQTDDSEKPDQDSDRFGSGRDGALCDGSSELIDISGVALTGAFSMFFVLYRNGTAMEPLIASLAGPGTGLQIYNTGTGSKLYFDPGAPADVQLSASAAIGNGERKVLDVHRDSSDDWLVYKNGADITQGTPNDGTTVNCNRMGQGFGGFANLSYGMFAVYDAELTGAQISNIRSRIQDRWTVD